MQQLRLDNMILYMIDRGLNYLSSHWILGVISGVSSWSLLRFFTSPDNLELVRIFGAWGAGMICGITLLLKLIEGAEVIAVKIAKLFRWIKQLFKKS